VTTTEAGIGESERAPALRIFSYLPSPRLAKATIAARLCGVTLEVRGAAPRELARWLWDFDSRPLNASEASGTQRAARTGFAGTLHKTDSFLAAHPFGTVPAAFSPDGSIGVFESNAIARAVVRLAPGPTRLYGDEAYTASRIDAFLDASLVFARRPGLPARLANGGGEAADARSAPRGPRRLSRRHRASARASTRSWSATSSPRRHRVRGARALDRARGPAVLAASSRRSRRVASRDVPRSRTSRGCARTRFAPILASTWRSSMREMTEYEGSPS
jgi:glutathione S-transferase